MSKDILNKIYYSLKSMERNYRLGRDEHFCIVLGHKEWTDQNTQSYLRIDHHTHDDYLWGFKVLRVNKLSHLSISVE